MNVKYGVEAENTTGSWAEFKTQEGGVADKQLIGIYMILPMHTAPAQRAGCGLA
jgi:hypothetical protein